MIEDRINVTTFSLLSLIVLILTLIFEEIAIGLAFAMIAYPYARKASK